MIRMVVAGPLATRGNASFFGVLKSGFSAALLAGVSLAALNGSANATCTGMGTTTISCSSPTADTGQFTTVLNGGNINATLTNWQMSSGRFTIETQTANATATINASGVTITNGLGDGDGALHAGATGAGGNAAITISNSSIDAVDANGYGIASHAENATGASSLNATNVVVHMAAVASGPGVLAVSDGTGSSSITFTGGSVVTENGIAAVSAQSGSGNVTVRMSGGTVTTTGNNAIAVNAWVQNGAGNIILENADTISTQGSSAYGVRGNGAAGTVSITNNGVITTAGASSHGAYGSATGAGTVVIHNQAMLTTGGDNAFGIRGVTAAGALDINNIAKITTGGVSASGIQANTQNGSITITNTAVITTSGNQASAIYGLAAATTGKVGITNSGALSTGSDNAHGIFAQVVDGAINIDNSGDIAIHGATGSKGIYAIKTGAGNITINNTANIQTDIPASFQYGIEAKAGSNATITVNNDGTVAGGSFGIVTWSQFVPHTGSAATVNLGASSVVKALYGVTMDMSDANTLNIAHGGLISTRSQAIQFRSYGGSATPVDTVNNSGVIESARDQIMTTSFATESGTVLNFNNKADGLMTGIMMADKAAVTVHNEGQWNLRNFADMNGAGRDTLAVAISDFGTSGANSVTNSGTIALLGKGTGTVTTLDTTGMYLPNGYSFNAMGTNSPAQGQLLGVQTFNNSGVIDLTANVENGVSVVGDVLVISGGHNAGTDGGGVFVANGGTLKLNTVLNEGGANSQSDILVVDSTAMGTGANFIQVNAAAGSTGAWTVGNGILLVEVLNKAQSANGVFMLSAPVISGASQYYLYHNGVDNDGADGNWYLRNVYTPPPSPPGCETTGTCVPQPPVPIIQPEVAVAMTLPPLAIEYGYAMLDTLHERVGETFITAAPVTEERVVWCKDASRNFKCVVKVPVAVANGANARDETRWAKAGWARLLGDRGIRNANNFWTHGADYNYSFWGIQAGLDLYAREQADGTLDKAGIYVGYGQIDSKVKDQFGGRAGTVDMDAYTVGGYWTHFSPNNWYTDAVVQGTWYTDTQAKSVAGQMIKPDGFGILASLEGGYSFKLKDGWTIEPQTQIVYQNVTFDNASDGLYANYSFKDGESLRGRLGLRVTKTWNRADEGQAPRLITGWLRGNIWHEFLGNTKTVVSNLNGLNAMSFGSPMRGTWGEIGAGVTAQMSDKINLFATGAYQRSLDNKGREGWDGRLGMTIKW